MSFTIALSTLLLVVFLVWLVLTLVRGEANRTAFWWEILLALAVLAVLAAFSITRLNP